MRKYFLIFFLLTIFFACTTKSTKQVKSNNQILTSKNHFSNIIKVEQYGDSARLEIEKQGDTLIKHYIDLKGLTDDNFNNSYNVVCNYETIKNNTSVNSDCFFVEGDFKLYFNKDEIISYCDSIIQHLKSNDWDNDVIKPPYEELKKFALHKNSTYSIDKMQELILNLNSKIVNQKTKEIPKSILVEFYKTEFSAGKNFYVITNKSDTVEWFHQMNYIN